MEVSGAEKTLSQNVSESRQGIGLVGQKRCNGTKRRSSLRIKRPKGFPWIYVAILIVMAFTGFGQMPIFKRYYISDIPRHGLVCRLLFDPLHSLSRGNSPFRPYRLGDSRFSLPWKKDKKAKSFRLRADTPSGGNRANKHPARHEEPTRRDFLSHVHPGYRHLSPRVRHGLHPGRAPLCNLPFDLDGVLGRGSMTAGRETKMFSSCYPYRTLARPEAQTNLLNAQTPF